MTSTAASSPSPAPSTASRLAAAPRALGLGDLIAARLLVETGGAGRFTSDAALARHAGCAPIEVSSGRSSRHRLSHMGNRKLNAALIRSC
jgi:transposase